jgi:hypothetical protein
VGATVPVQVISTGCSIDPFILTVRYSPQFKKAVFFESFFGYAERGDYILADSSNSPQEGVDQAIYGSVEVFK